MLLMCLMIRRFLRTSLPISFMIWEKRWTYQDLRVVKVSLWFHSWLGIQTSTKLQLKSLKLGMESFKVLKEGCCNSVSFFLFYFIYNFIKNLIFFMLSFRGSFMSRRIHRCHISWIFRFRSRWQAFSPLKKSDNYR